MRRTCRLLTLLIVFAVLMAWGAPPTSPQDQSQPDQSQQSQEKSDKDQQKKKKKGGGFFGGLKAVTGESSEQQEVTATAGSKTVGEGEQIGSAQPTAADRQAVNAMEKYSIPEKDVKKFQDDGQLKPKQ